MHLKDEKDVSQSGQPERRDKSPEYCTLFILLTTYVATTVDRDSLCKRVLEKPPFGITSLIKYPTICWRNAEEDQTQRLEDILETQNRTILAQKPKNRLYGVDGVEGLVMDFAAMSLDPGPEDLEYSRLDNSVSQCHFGFQ
ncbi:hypothetical protein BKA70DRAFT_1243165 [Coprinopsis sp. MPI-PUGE-AT-0042]|nr:hypothetical protein BKA70DRAFT_1243165 [Coprinopsis sp. MPI-PUGE-AT-0042]